MDVAGTALEYEVVRTLEIESTRVRTTEGQVRIETELGRQLREAEIKELTKPKL